MRPSEALLAGIELLDPVLLPHHFRFLFQAEGRGSGGDFAWGEYVCAERRLELHFRWSLGIVLYHLDEVTLNHTEYMRALGVSSGSAKYPGFSDDPLDGFRHLAHDLMHFGEDFLTGDAIVLRRAAPAEMARLAARGQEDAARYEGDDARRQEARTHFRAQVYTRVVELLESLRYPELMRPSERQMLEVARQRAAV